VAKMLDHTTLHMLVSRYYQYMPNLTRKDGRLLAKWLECGKAFSLHRGSSFGSDIR
jgi:hypothetical protein